jgi:parallel beta-helix repeat protein
MKNLRFVFIFSLFMFAVGLLFPWQDVYAGPCEVSGFISSNTTWSPATCNPYIVTGNIIVQNGVTLTILPGTTIKFDSLKALDVQGILIAQGTFTNRITFTSNQPNPAKGDWGYIGFTNASLSVPSASVWSQPGMATFTPTVTPTSTLFPTPTLTPTPVSPTPTPTSPPLGESILQYVIIEFAGGTIVENNGALRINASSPTLDHLILRENAAAGIYIWGESSPLITNSTITDNEGTGIHLEGTGIGFISGNTISNNVAPNEGGGISVQGLTTSISGNIITGNSAHYGGGIRAVGDTGLIENNLISSNSAWQGGGIYLTGAVTIQNNTITGNMASGVGGGILAFPGVTNVITGNVVTLNTATHGGGIYAGCCSEISNNQITENTATETNQGGGIYVEWEGNIVNHNNLFSNWSGNPATTPNDLTNGSSTGSPDLNAENNYWGSAEANVIETFIWHFLDDASLPLVDYTPFLTQALDFPSPALAINYASGAPGSYFTITGADFPASSVAYIFVNTFPLGSVNVESSGTFTFLLVSAAAGEGNYLVTASGYPDAQTSFVLDNEAPQRPQEGEGEILNLPPGIVPEGDLNYSFLPFVTRE